MNRSMFRSGLLTAAMLSLVSVDVSAGAWLDQYLNPHRDYQNRPKEGTPTASQREAPEIDAGSGTNAIALLAVAVLLMRERARSRRS